MKKMLKQNTHSSLSLDLLSCVLNTDIWNSRKHDRNLWKNIKYISSQHCSVLRWRPRLRLNDGGKGGKAESNANKSLTIADWKTHFCNIDSGPAIWPSSKARMVSRRTSARVRLGPPLSSKGVVCGHCLVTLFLTANQSLKCISSLPILIQEWFWWWLCSVSLFPISGDLGPRLYRFRETTRR